jgi:hypothetical protein
MSNPSQAQFDANRRNAKHGRGPTSPHGKNKSSQNAMRHGLTGRVVVLPSEDMEIYKSFSKELVDSLNPATPMECQLAQTVADTQWRLNRARSYEDGMLALGSSEEGGRMNSALSAAKVFRDNSKAFVNLSLYEQRLSRQQKEAFRQLRELQAERKAAAPVESKPLTQAATAMDMRLPAAFGSSLPAATSEEIGFVYSDTLYDVGACQSPFMGDTAFDPIYFKNSVPAPGWAKSPNKKAA